ncbi:T9SS type A sorting domain-containing protein [Hymenobacter sp. B1770]|uniref:T9SS type A sorting domain-containing protein n=1 Tax=Hymenobacter sp. B1770 TaxID=1718788 RepID=UPI003CF35265
MAAPGVGTTYTWSNGATGPSITVSQPGDYQATATTSNGTGYSNVVRVSAPPAVTVQVTPAGPLTLPGGGNATLTATATMVAFNAANSGIAGTVLALAVQPDGKVLVGGGITNYVRRLNADGSLDRTFNVGGIGANGTVQALALQPNGKILIAGNFTAYNGNAAAPNYVLRLNADGTLDTSFNSGGTGIDGVPLFTGNPIEVHALALQLDGKILVGGNFRSYNGNASAPDGVLRLNADGTLDSGFNNGGTGVAGNAVYALTVQADGKVVVGGAFTSYNGAAVSDFVLRLNVDGTRDPRFNSSNGFNNVSIVYALAVQADGKLLVGGYLSSFSRNAGAPDAVLRLNADGTLDTGFSNVTGANNGVFALTVQADGKVIIAGRFTSYRGTAVSEGILRLNADGTLDTGFNNGGTGVNHDVHALAVQADGKVLIGGNFSSYNGNAITPHWILRLNADGTPNNTATPLMGATFVFNPGNTAGATRILSTAGTYTATATDPATGCTYLSNAVVVTITAPVISTLTPSNGPTGSLFDVAGTDLSGATAVTFTSGSTATSAPAGFVVAGNTRLTGVQVPAGLAPGPYAVTVTTVGGTSNGLAFTVVVPAPTLTAISPTSGPVGTSVTITGTNLTNVTGVSFNGTAATIFSTGTGTTATATVPAGATTGLVTATTSGGTSTGVTFTVTNPTPVITATSWTGLVSTDWFAAGNWSAGVPTPAVDALVPAAAPNMPAVAAGTATARALTLNAGATLTQTGGTLDVRADLTNNGTFQPTGGTVVLGTSTLANVLGSGDTRFWNLTVDASGAQSATAARTAVQRLFTLTGAFATQGNPLTLESNATNTALVVNNGGVIIGSATVQRYLAPNLNAGVGYRHFSAPVGTATVASLTTASFTPVVNPNYNTSATPTTETPFPTVYGYDQARLATTANNLNPFDKGWFSPASLSAPLAVGQGYTVNVAANQTLAVTGPPNTGPVTQALGRNSGATAPEAGWALVGNPYPSPLDYALVAPADRPNLDAAVYVFESTSPYGGSYRAIVNGVGGNPVLALGQGFFVRVSTGQTSGTLTLRNSHRVTAYQNPAFQRSAETRPLVQLTLQGAGLSDPVYVYFENGATPGVDRERDAVKLPNSHGLNVSADAGMQRLAINALPALATAPVTVPLTVGVPAAGSYTFHAAQLLNLITTPVYLRDRQTGAVVDLTRQPRYNFVVSNASDLIAGRFELVFSPQAVLATAPAAMAAQVGVYPNPATAAVFVELPAALSRIAVTAALVDVLGRVVRTQTLPAGLTTHTLPLANVATGVYALRLHTDAGLVVKKLVVE